MKSGAWLSVSTHVGAALAGFLLSRMVKNIGRFSLDTVVDPLAALAFLYSLLISVVLYRRFESRKYSDQLRKNAALGRLRASFDNLVHLEGCCSANQFQYTDAVRLITKCRREFEQYLGYAAAMAFPVRDTHITSYQLIWSDLRHLLTYTSPTPTMNDPIRVDAGVVTCSPDRMVEVERRIDDGRRLLFEIEKEIIAEV